MTKINSVYLIEDELIVHELVQEYFSTQLKKKKLLGTSTDAENGIEMCAKKKPDLVLLDIRMPEVNGLEALRILKMKTPDTKVLIFSGSVEEEAVKLAVDGKADGFICKSDGIMAIGKAIEVLEKGHKYYSESVSKLIIAS